MNLHEQRVHVVLPIHNRLPLTLKFVDSLILQTHPNIHLLLIDDGSTDQSDKVVKSRFKNTTVLYGNGKLWWAGALQKSHEWFLNHPEYENDFVLIQNNDTVLPPNFLDVGLRILSSSPGAFLCAAGKDIRDGGKTDSGGYYFNFEEFSFHETFDQTKINCMSTRGLIARVQDFVSVGGFYPHILPHYLSDIEFTYRAGKKGLKLITTPEFYCLIDFETTGIKELGHSRFIEMLRKMFSIRYSGNPVYWTTFFILASPRKYMFKNILKVWRSVYQQVVVERFWPGFQSRIRRLMVGK